jgi:hypothetical protein
MTARHERPVALLLLAAAVAIAGCGPRREQGVGSGESAFAATQARGAQVMGVDQYTSAHVFEDLPDGGRIVLDRADPADTAGIATIRRHMQSIAAAFRAGDFAQPFRVHAQTVPGTAVMAADRDAIHYEAVTRPRGLKCGCGARIRRPSPRSTRSSRFNVGRTTPRGAREQPLTLTE